MTVQTLSVFPAYLGGFDPAQVIADWNEAQSPALVITPDLAASAAYLVVGGEPEAADEVFEQHSTWPSKPVIWIDAGGNLSLYRCAKDFGEVRTATFEEVFPAAQIAREDLLNTLIAVERALDDASSVVDPGEEERFAYKSERHGLRALIDQLERGAVMIESPASGRVSLDYERTCAICGHLFKYAESHSRDLGPESVDLCSQACAAKYWERSDNENDSVIRCPKCGGETIFVVQVACMEHAQYHTGHWPLNTDGFAWDESGTHRDGSTEDEVAECGDCGYCCPAGALHEFGFGQQSEDITCDSMLCSRSTCNGCPLDADDDDARPEDDEAGDDVCDNCHTAGVPISQTCSECGRTLCADCAAEVDGLCGACAAEKIEDAPPTSG